MMAQKLYKTGDCYIKAWLPDKMWNVKCFPFKENLQFTFKEANVIVLHILFRFTNYSLIFTDNIDLWVSEASVET